MNISKKHGNLHRAHPTQLRLEVAQGCTRNCKFCGIITVGNVMHTMSIETMDCIIASLPTGTKRIDFSLGGEPLLNENLPYLISKLRTKSPKVQISILSNTDVLVYNHKNIDYLLELFDSGLNFYHSDIYDKNTGIKYLELLKENKEKIVGKNIKALNFYAIDYNIWSYHGGKNKEILVCDEHNLDVRKNKVSRRLHNWGGNMSLDQHIDNKIVMKTLQTKCAEPFVSLPIDYSGRYFLCCIDFSKSLILGNVKLIGIEDMWSSETMDQLRWILENKRRDLIPICSMCTKKSFRSGLYYYSGKHYDLEAMAKKFRSMSHITQHQKNILALFNKD